jgi:hypothetical protein
MANIIKVLRSIVAGTRPSGRTYGEPYVNLSDNQIGVFDSSNVARDLIGVPFFSPSATYISGQPVNYQGRVYVAKMNIVPGAWNSAQWAMLGYKNRNYIINGAMQISQQNGLTAGSTSIYYPVDQFYVATSIGAYSFAQVASPTPSGSPNRIRLTVTTAPGAIGTSDYLFIAQRIEGLRVADLRLGSTAAKTVTLQFGCKGPAGSYAIALRNGATNRCYNTPFTIAAGEANTDVVRAVTIPLDQTGTWAIDYTLGLEVFFTFYVGTTFQTAANVWSAGNAICPTGGGTNIPTGSVFELFDVGLYEGVVAPAFQMPDYVTELDVCRRYYFKEWCVGSGTRMNTTANGTVAISLNWPYPMRTTPTIGNTWGGAVRSSDGQYGISNVTSTTVGGYAPSSNGDISPTGGMVGITYPAGISTTIDMPSLAAVILDASARL